MNSISTPEHLFQFELAPVETIEPWGDANEGNLSLSLYALTLGRFRISAGTETLLRYTPEIISHWGLMHEYGDYQVACFADDILASASAVISPLPAFFENIIRDKALFSQLQKSPAKHSHKQVPSGVIDGQELGKNNRDFEEDDYKENYNAFRWLGERSIWLNYLTACPQMWFVRVENEVWIQWDNVDRKIEGIEVWTARHGTYALSVQAFQAECLSFSERLLSAMEARIVNIEKGIDRPQIPLDTASLRHQLLKFKNDFKKLRSNKYEPSIAWDDAEKALRNIALNQGITLPAV